jgi:hypothetical protein
MIWVIVMVKSHVFSTGFQMFSKNAYMNMFVYAAFNKMMSTLDAAMHPHTITLSPSCFTIG